MAKPRVFLSSTCFDLTDARASLTSFLEEYGFEVLNSQTASFGVKPKAHSHDACLAEVEQADYVVLIIGGRRGGTYISGERSITNEEIKVAQRLSLPIIAFIDRRVDDLRPTYKRNPNADFSATVDDVRIFDFVDFIASGHEDNWLHPFSDVNDIKRRLKSQFAHYLLLYSKGLRPRRSKQESAPLRPVGFPSNLENLPADSEVEATPLRKGLRIAYDTLKNILDADVPDSVKKEQLKAVWLVAKHGQAGDRMIWMKEDRFKGSAWARSRGQRVFTQMEGTGLTGRYDYNEDSEGRPFGTVEISFDSAPRGSVPAEALSIWVAALAAAHGDEGLDVFSRLDLRLFAGESSRKSSKRRRARR
jgi:hypothetical protein